jgi:hypothetical protein
VKLFQAGLAAGCALLIGAAPVVPAASLDWMAGDWIAIAGDQWTEEHWLPARGGVMLGLNRSGRADRLAGFEFMRIAPDAGGRPVFHASPGGAAPVAFPLTAATPTSALFENPAHDFPTIIRYRRQGNRLLAEMSGPGGAGLQRWTFEPRNRP